MKQDILFTDFANDAVSKLPTDEDKAQFDIVTIILITSLIIGIIRLIMQCRKTARDVHDIAKNPTIFERRLLNREIRRALGFRKNLIVGEKFAEAILTTASDYDITKLEEMFEKVED